MTKNGYTYWSFATDTTSKGTYTVTYTATTNEDVLTKTISIKVGDNVAPTLSFNKGELTQDFIYDGENKIEYVLEVNKSKKTFVVKVINNGEEVVSHNLGLVISDKDDKGTPNNNMSWTNLSYELTGENVTTGETSTSNGTKTTQYLIGGTGKYTLTLTMSDSYDNERKATIEFNVVAKSEVKENKDTVVGAVLIVISLILLAGVILFFTFTGKKGVKSNKTKKEKVVKTKKTTTVQKDDVKVDETEVVVENNEEVETQPEVVEEDTTVEEESQEEPKTGDVE